MKISSSESKVQDLSISSGLDVQQLDNIKAHLDLILLVLEALAKLNSESILQAVHALELEKAIADRIELWQPRQAGLLHKSSAGRKKLDIEETKSLVLIICYLAKQYQELIRRAVSLLEQVSSQGKEPHQVVLLGDYLDTFSRLYENHREDQPQITHTQLSQLALKLLVELLFYSTNNGHRRLWLALLNYSHSPYPTPPNPNP